MNNLNAVSLTVIDLAHLCKLLMHLSQSWTEKEVYLLLPIEHVGEFISVLLIKLEYISDIRPDFLGEFRHMFSKNEDGYKFVG